MRKAIALLVLVLLISGCATTSSITPKLSLGMTKQEILAKCGQPFQAGAVKGSDGKTYESFMYKENICQTSVGIGTFTPVITYVWFSDGKVVYYGGNPNIPTEEIINEK